MRLIDADALKKDIHCSYSDDLEILEHIDAQPIIEPERPHGEWIYNQYYGNPNVGNWHCSECRHIVYVGYGQKPDYNFCPKCGADLRQKEGNE